MRTFEPAAGAVPGTHRVRIRKIEWIYPDGYQPPKLVDEPPRPPVEPKARWLIPERYGDYETSGLTALVEDKQNEFQFELTSSD